MSLVFFTDRDLGTGFPDTLAAAGLRVEQHRDHFAPDCSDEDWLAAIIRHRVALLIVVGKVPLPLLAQNFVATAPKILAFLEHHRPPIIAKVYRPSPSELASNPAALGAVVSWYPR